MAICLVHFIQDFLALSSCNIALLLSWCKTLSQTSYPCPSKKLLVHSICGNASCMPINSLSIELHATSFCLVELLYTDPWPINIYVAYNASTHHRIIPSTSAQVNHSGRSFMPFKYFITLTNFLQSLSGVLTLVLKNNTVVLMSGCAH